MGWHLVIAGALKGTYDLLLVLMFRSRAPRSSACDEYVSAGVLMLKGSHAQGAIPPANRGPTRRLRVGLGEGAMTFQPEPFLLADQDLSDLPAFRGPGLGLRTALILPLFPPPQKN